MAFAIGKSLVVAKDMVKKYLNKIPQTYYVAVVITCLLLLFTVLNPTEFFNTVKLVNTAIFDVFGQFYLWFVFITLIAFVVIGFSPLGNIKIGGKDAKPEHSFFSWFSMLFCAGMGIGLLFWGGAEPLFFYMNPPVEGTTNVELDAFKLAFLHWGLHPWAIYGFTTLAVCFFSMNLKRGMYFSSFLAEKSKGITKAVIDNITVLAILFGVVASFGMGVIQFEGGITLFTNLESSSTLQLYIIFLVTLCYMASTIRGLNKGIKVLSNISMVFCFVLAGVIFFVLPFQEFFASFFKAISGYFMSIPDLSIGNLPFKDPYFTREWTAKYWTWWIAWAPFVGIFTALVSKGRTVRELVFSMLIAPTLFSLIWFGIFGKAAIMLQTGGGFAGATVDYTNVNLIFFKIINDLLASPFFNMIGLALVSVFFINSADSATYTLAAVTNKKQNSELPPFYLKMFWGITFSVLTAIFLFTGGLEILQYITLIAVLPFSFLLLIIFIKLIFDMTKYYKKAGYNE